MDVSDRMSFCEEKRTGILFFNRLASQLVNNITDQRLLSTNLQVLRAKLMSIHVDGGQEDGFHLIMPQLVRWQMGSDQDL